MLSLMNAALDPAHDLFTITIGASECWLIKQNGSLKLTTPNEITSRGRIGHFVQVANNVCFNPESSNTIFYETSLAAKKVLIFSDCLKPTNVKEAFNGIRTLIMDFSMTRVQYDEILQKIKSFNNAAASGTYAQFFGHRKEDKRNRALCYFLHWVHDDFMS